VFAKRWIPQAGSIALAGWVRGKVPTDYALTGQVDVNSIRARGLRLCPVLCPPPNPTECYRLRSCARNTNETLYLVAFHRNSSHSV